jgi:hypothetical protein
MKDSVSPSNPQEYVRAVLTLYLELPETSLRANAQDQNHARQLQQRGVPLIVIESAFLLASLRRLARPADCPPLSPIRSLAYFQPVIDELLSNPAPDHYVEYLRRKMQHFAGDKIAGRKQHHPAKVQENTDSDDR